MPEPSTFIVFVAAAVALLVVPGPAVIFIVTRSVTHGRTGGLVSVLGVHTGSVVHVAAVLLGVAAVRHPTPPPSGVVKPWVPPSLFFLAPRRLRPPGPAAGAPPSPPLPPPRLYRQGIVVNVLNPKTAIFFLAFLPS